MSLLVNFSASVSVSVFVNIISLYILPVSVIYDLSPSSTSVLHHIFSSLFQLFIPLSDSLHDF